MTQAQSIEVNEENLWRLDAPKVTGWKRDVRPGTKKYYMVSTDTHLSPPKNIFKERIEKQYLDRLPRVEVRDGRKYLIMEGLRPEPIMEPELKGEDLVRTQAGGAPSHIFVDEKTGQARIEDQDLDGVDAEVIFPNGMALLMFAAPDPEFVMAQCRIWNDWAWEVCGPYKHRMAPTAGISTGNVDIAIKEVERVAKMGFKALCMPWKPIPGPHDASHVNYNHPVYDRLWAAIQDHDLAITYHIGTGKDPRTARGNGGAIVNYVIHAMSPAMEPMVNMCAAGVFERFPKLRAATIEADAGWVAWMNEKMDECYRKHHFWVRPKLKALPSDYYRSNCFATFGEDDAAIDLVEKHGLQNNLMWANDYPHHEGSWPHSAESIYRTLENRVSEDTRAKLLGLNAARCFGFEVPKEFLD